MDFSLCECCGRVFKKKMKTSKYCSRECGQKSYLSRTKENRHNRYIKDKPKRQAWAKDYYKKNKAHRDKKSKEWAAANRDKINERALERYHNSSKIISEERKKYHKEYWRKNKKELQKYHKERLKKNPNMSNEYYGKNKIRVDYIFYNKKTCPEEIRPIIEGLIYSRKLKNLTKESKDGKD